MSLLVRRCRNRSNQLEQYVETWHIDHKAAMYACDLEQLVQECLELAPLLRQAWDCAVERLFDKSERSERVFAEEEAIRQVISRAPQVFRKISNLIDDAEREGYAIDGAEKFREGLRDLELLEKEVESQWPLPDAQQMREAVGAYKRGEYKSAEDILLESQGDGADAD